VETAAMMAAAAATGSRDGHEGCGGARCRSRVLLLLVSLHGLLAKEWLPPLGSELNRLGDSRVATISCVGVQGAPLSRSVLGKQGVVERSPTSLVLINEPNVPDAALGVAAGDVVVLEVLQADLVDDTPHGVAQLKPVLQRALQLDALKPQQKMLMVVVTDADTSEASESDLRQLAQLSLNRIWRTLRKPANAAALDELFSLELVALPDDAAKRESAIAAFEARFCAADSPGYLFSEGALSCSAATARSRLAALYKANAPAPQMSAPPSEVAASHACALLTESAAKSAAKAVAALKKEAEPAYLPDFGERVDAVLAAALDRFDAQAADLQDVAAIKDAREALRTQLLRSLYNPYRKQLTHLQRQALTKFSQKLATMKPSATVEDDLRKMIKESSAALDQDAKRLLPTDSTWSYTYEKNSVLTAIAESAANHVETLRVQGLYLPKTGQKVPVDLSAHWLLLSPFGVDARYDIVSSKDKPKYRPELSPMRLSATDGFKQRYRDPKDMVFGDKLKK